MAARYRHCGIGLVRAAALSMSDVPGDWPNFDDPQSCRAWLIAAWSRPDLEMAIRHASESLANGLDAIIAGRPVSDARLRRAAAAVVRYVLRATGRHTPFGLFAGVAPVSVSAEVDVQWGDHHRTSVRADTQWLADVVDWLERCGELLARLDVMVTNLAERRGDRLEVPEGPGRVSLRCTGAVRLVQELAAEPIRFGELVDKVAETFPAAGAAKVAATLSGLVRHRVLVTALRAPMTQVDPLGHVVNALESAGAGQIDSVAPVLLELKAIQSDLVRHNLSDARPGQGARGRLAISERMRGLSGAGRVPIAVDLQLDCEVTLPRHLAGEVELAADALAQLTRQPTGTAPWREFYTAFCQRYGVGVLVPIRAVLSPEAGLGLPAGYPGSARTVRADVPGERDGKLLALAWHAIVSGNRELVLDDATIQRLRVGEPTAELRITPHIEMAIRIQSASREALQRGDYVFSVIPGRSAGTFTSRFASAPGSLSTAYAAAPTTASGALAVQLSFPPAYPHAENICRVPPHLPVVLPLGEHREPDVETVRLEDLAVMATTEAMHLVSLSRRRVVEPQVLHGLALDKQAPPLARFLVHLPRALGASWHRFDWGSTAERLPYLPRVRYRRAILAPATWRLMASDLLARRTSASQWRTALDRWRARWGCPDTVELNDGDRTLRLSVNVPAHAQILRAHLQRAGFAVLTETATDPGDYGWLDGHAHDVVLPLVATSTTTSAPPLGSRPVLTGHRHGQLPTAPDSTWLTAKLYSHPDQLDRIISRWLSDGVSGDQPYWFVRYRDEHEDDHLRLRLRGETAAARCDATLWVAAWAEALRQDGLIGRLAFDTYFPEVGRYGTGPAMAAAEEVFAADSRLVATQLLHEAVSDTRTVTATNLIAIVRDFLGDEAGATQWWLARRPPATAGIDKAAIAQVALTVDRPPTTVSTHPGDLRAAWDSRTDTLRRYRRQLGDDGLDTALSALLHMHHNRAVGVDRDHEATCHRLARQAVLAWTHRRGHA